MKDFLTLLYTSTSQIPFRAKPLHTDHIGSTSLEKIGSFSNDDGDGNEYVIKAIGFSGGSRPSDKGGPGHPDPEMREGGGGRLKKFFSALQASFCQTISRGRKQATTKNQLG